MKIYMEYFRVLALYIYEATDWLLYKMKPFSFDKLSIEVWFHFEERKTYLHKLSR